MTDTATPTAPATPTTSKAHAIEMWAGKILAALLTALFASGAIPTTGPVAQVSAIAAIVLSYLGFAVARTTAATTSMKTSQHGFAKLPLLIVLALIALVSCATLKAMTGKFAGCEKSDLGQIVKNEEGQAVPIATAVAQAVDNNDAALETWLLGVAKDVGLDTIECAIAAYDATHAPKAPTTGSGASTSQHAPNPGLTRAQAWLANQRAAKS